MLTPQQIRTLANVTEKPEMTYRDNLTIARRISRHACGLLDTIHAERRVIRREANKLREHLPFTKRAVDDLEQQSWSHRCEELSALRNILLTYGRMILSGSDGGLNSLGFDALADLLNINWVHREKARREGWHDLSDLVAIHDLENSSECRSDDWGAGSPLYRACRVVLMDFIMTAPEGTLPDPFAPGEVFGPKLPPQLQVVPTTREASPC